MTIATTELASFHHFIGEQLQHPAAVDMTPEEAIALWRERAATVVAVREGLDDIAAGRTRPLDEFVAEFRSRHHVSEPV